MEFQFIWFNDKGCIYNKILRKLVPLCLINNIAALVQIMLNAIKAISHHKKQRRPGLTIPVPSHTPGSGHVNNS